MHDRPVPVLTVVICTYNREQLLSECLQSLFDQNCGPDQFRILVVDNNSEDGTAALATRLSCVHENLRLTHEPRQGLSHARNKGLRESETNWVAFLDDDAKAGPGWVARILEIISWGRFDAFGGPYLPWYRDGKTAWYRDEYGSNLAWMPYRHTSDLAAGFFSGGNAAYHRTAALSAGGFPTDFGMCGNTLGYGEENRLQQSLRDHGLRLGFDPDLVIYHLVPLRKQTLRWFRDRKYTEGRDYLRMHDIEPSLQALTSHALAFIWIDLRNVMQATWRFLIGDYKRENVYIAIVPPLVFQREVLRGLVRAKARSG